MVARDGIPFIVVPGLAGIVLLLSGHNYAAVAMVLLAVVMALFFRDPERSTPSGQNLVVSPADGHVTRVERLHGGDVDSAQVVSIFLSIFDVHINRAPIAGRISAITYTRGLFKIATRQEASLVNEQNALTIEGERITVICRQIAGVLARRIVCWKKLGDEVRLGERFGLIKFSSRTDLVLPNGVQIVVRPGDRVRGGVTVIGRICS